MRVIAGRFGGRVLRAPKGSATRPTADRVREALFSVLGPLDGARVLDLYAGTGALGIEALSRGAARVTFVESGRSALAVLRSNVSGLGIDAEVDIVPIPVERATLAVAAHAPYDLVLCDPPWARLEPALEALEKLIPAMSLDASGRVVIEHPARAPLRFGRGWPLVGVDERTWGDTAVSIFETAR